MTVTKNIANYLYTKQSNAPLVVFRILFGALMVFSTLRFWWNGWIEDFYIDPIFHFKYFGFEWVQVLSPVGMYILFFITGLSALLILLGLFYRVAAPVFFLSFTYIELIDKTYYLNHYYFVSLVAFILIFLPANQRLSLDARLGLAKRKKECYKGSIFIIQFQLAVVYIFAGIAKIHPDWLLHAQPLQNWLHTNHHLPIVGPLLKYKVTAYIMSWTGMLYDLFIVFFLAFRKTRLLGYSAVVFFHIFTWILFPIGVFPWVMIGATLIFFSVNFHEKIVSFLERNVGFEPLVEQKSYRKVAIFGLTLYIGFQVLFPFRFVLYSGDLFWKEQGYRFSWRVMLMEKAGNATFYIEDQKTGGRITIDNTKYLTPNQEKMMATQPDMILEYAQFLQKEFDGKVLTIDDQSYEIEDPKVFADIYVTLNGSGSKQFVSNQIDLAQIPNNLQERTWVRAYVD